MYRRSSCPVAVLAALASLALAACGRGPGKEYEYEEDIHLSLDGSAVVYVNASLPSLVALAGLDLPVDPSARFDRQRIRRAFESPAVHVGNVTGWRRHRRRFASIRLEVPDIRKLSLAPPFARSKFEFQRDGDIYVYRQALGPSAARQLSDVGWTGEEMVAVRLHVPSRIEYHNAGAGNLKRGNILVWEQTLEDRHSGVPLLMEARMQSKSILYTTLWLFGASIAVALSVLAGIIFWVVRRKPRP
ncbi:MAG: hypothetical protein ACE148_17390 [Vicinamibacterales bacterium]